MSGPLDNSPADITRQLLSDMSLVSIPSTAQGSSDWPAWVGILPSNPGNAITITNTAGLDDGSVMIDGEQQEAFGVSIIVRSLSHSTAYSKAKAIKDALDTGTIRTTVTISGNSYLVQAFTTTSGPIYAGKEEQTQRLLYTVNAVVDVRQTA